MASLKDMRNRIASVKATRKITKAMQMVAAAKLRRAQEAAQPRGPMPSAWTAVLGSLASKVADKTRRVAAARRHRQGSGAPADRHDGRARSLRRLQLEHRQARPRRCTPADRRRQDGQDLDGRPQGRRQPAPRSRQEHRRARSTSRASSSSPSATPRASRRRCLTCSKPASSTSRRSTSREFKIGHLAEADGAAAHSGQDSGSEAPTKAAKGADAPSTNTSRAKRRSSASCCTRNISTQIFRGLLENARLEHGSRMSAMDNATRNAGDMINKLTIKYNRQRQANITKELIEIISGAEAL